jgi:hypothetical protein
MKRRVLADFFGFWWKDSGGLKRKYFFVRIFAFSLIYKNNEFLSQNSENYLFVNKKGPFSRHFDAPTAVVPSHPYRCARTKPLDCVTPGCPFE